MGSARMRSTSSASTGVARSCCGRGGRAARSKHGSRSTKRRNHLRGEQLQMRLRPTRRQSRRQRPRIEVCDWYAANEVPNHVYRGVGVDDLEKAALPELFANAQLCGQRLKVS